MAGFLCDFDIMIYGFKGQFVAQGGNKPKAWSVAIS
jgi:hypothetical protein